MSFEGPPPNSFRSALRSGSRRSPLAAAKKPKSAQRDGLGTVNITRSEQRLSNQRGSDRHRLADNQAVVRHGKTEQQVDLINLSRGGAMVAGKLKARLWDSVELVLGEFGMVECAVRWVRGNRYGLEFAHETRIECDPEVEDQVLRDVIRNCFPDVETEAFDGQGSELLNSDRARRHPLIWNGILHHDYESDVVRLRNISAGGAMVDCAATLPEGVTVYIELDRVGRTAATVCWSKGGQSGLAFHQPFDLARLSNAAPELTAVDWVQPDYLRQEDEQAASPWADRWGRLTLSELNYTLKS